jgi:hypothetical protein
MLIKSRDLIMQTGNQASFDSIINSGEQLYQLAKNLDIVELEKEIPKYTQTIEAYFVNQDKQNITQLELNELEQLVSVHKKITSLLSNNKEKILKNIKQLHTGKEMQNTYLQTIRNKPR